MAPQGVRVEGEPPKDLPEWARALVLVVTTIAGSFGVAYWQTRDVHSLVIDPNARPDPFTGTMARQMESKLQYQLTDIVEHVHKLEARLLDTERAVNKLPPRELLSELAEHRAQLRTIEARLTRLENGRRADLQQ